MTDVLKDVVVERKKWDALYAAAAKLEKAFVKVGVLAGKGGETTRGAGGMSLIEIAATHEFGSPAAHIPERSFLRSTFLVRRVNALITKQTELARAIIMKGLDPIRALEMLGTWAAGEVKNTITEIDIPPPLADSTIMAKGSSKPLVDTGLMKNSITYEVVEGDGV